MVNKTPWWGTREQVSARLQVEYKAMRGAFQETFKLIIPQFGIPVLWKGTVFLNMEGIEQREHTLKIVYPGNCSAWVDGCEFRLYFDLSGKGDIIGGYEAECVA